MEKRRVLLYQLLCLALTIVVFVLVMQIPDKSVKQEGEIQFQSPKETVLSVIHSRKSVRNFVPQKTVSKEDLQLLVKAGMAAPTAANKQPWAFIVVTERAVLDTLAGGLPYAKMLKDVGAAIVVCGDLTKAIESEPEFWVQDCSAATENILLAVEAMGLGAVWTGVYPGKERVMFVQKALLLPENIIPLNVIPVGYSAGGDAAKDKWKEENLHWEKW